MAQPLTDQQLIALYQQHAGSPSHPQSGPSDQDLIAAFHNAAPMGWGEDAARSLVTGLEKGATGLLGTPRAITEGAGNLTVAGANAGLHAFGQPSLTPQQAGLAHAIASRGLNAMMTGGAITPEGPTAAGMNTVVQKVAGPYHDPQTWGARAAETVGEMALAGLLPGGPIARAARVAIPAAGSESAGELAHGTPYEGAARFGGALAGGGLEGGGEAMLAAPQRVLGRAAQGLTQQQIGLASALRSKAAAQGVDLTVPEAVQQVTGGSTGLGRVQRLVENANRTAPQVAPYFAKRPGQVRGAVMNFADQVAPASGQPGMVGARAQQTGQGVLDSIRQDINAQAAPYYAELPNQALPDDQFAQLAKSPAYQAAQQQLRGDPILNGPVAHLPDNNLAVVNEVVKQLDRGATANAQTAMNPGGNNQVSAAYSGARGQADDLASALSFNWRAARYIGANGRATALEPVQNGPVGAIAQSPELSTQTGALFPANPAEGSPDQTRLAMALMASRNPEIAAQLARQHVVNSFNQSARDLASGPSQYSGAMFAKNIAGNAEQAATLNAGLDVVNAELPGKWNDLASVLQATGQRQRPGSMTAFNADDLAGLKQAPGVARFIGAAGDPLEWTRALSNWTGGKLYGRNMDVLANMIRDPDTAAVLQRALGATPSSPLAQLLSPASQYGASQ